jgi:hypothetical protein
VEPLPKVDEAMGNPQQSILSLQKKGAVPSRVAAISFFLKEGKGEQRWIGNSKYRTSAVIPSRISSDFTRDPRISRTSQREAVESRVE